MTKKVYIATSRPNEIGNRCKNWAENNTPSGFELTDDLEECDIFISVLYDSILSKPFISGKCCYNFHPGILPNYRGAGAYSWVLIDKVPTTGVTLHEINSDIDSGPIIEISRTPIYYYDTAESLFNRCMEHLYLLFTKQYKNLLSGDYTTKINNPIGGHIYWRKDLEEAKDISHIIKAFTFENKESAYWIDSKGIQRHIHWE